MKVRIDPERCQGHGMCNMVCPSVFKYDDDFHHTHLGTIGRPRPAGGPAVGERAGATGT